jgi:phosphatidylinositol glycan class O
MMLLTDVVGSVGETAYASIHQIDLVATISFLLGIPIPYANLGSLVPSLLPNMTAAHTATALALNAAQVWRYFTVYSKTAQQLPNLPDLQERLRAAVHVFQEALAITSNSDVDTTYTNMEHDATLFHKAAALFKIFLLDATELGKRVWTRFDHVGMIVGGTILFMAFIMTTWSLLINGLEETTVTPATTTSWMQPIVHAPLELGLTIAFMIFHCVLLSFSNSYIDTEQHIVIFMLAVLGIAICLRHAQQVNSSITRNSEKVARPSSSSSARLTEAVALVIPVCARLGEHFVSGHGLDPSLQAHFAHNAGVFLFSLAMIGLIRWNIQQTIAPSWIHLWMDLAALGAMAASWWEKHMPDPNRNGFFWCRVAYSLITTGFVHSILRLRRKDDGGSTLGRTADSTSTILFKLLTAIMAVTGPSTATSTLLFLLQVGAFWSLLQGAGGSIDVSDDACFALRRIERRGSRAHIWL